MLEVRHHCHDMILNIANVEADVLDGGWVFDVRSKFVVMLIETLENVGLETQEPGQARDVLSDCFDLHHESPHVLDACCVDLVVNIVDSLVDLGDGYGEGVHNIIPS